jgi:hypothetical protein
VAATLPASAYLGEEGKIRPDMKDRPPVARRVSPWADVVFSALAHGAAWLTLALLAGILVSLVIGAAPAIRAYGLSFLWTSEWDPVQTRYGGQNLPHRAGPAELAAAQAALDRVDAELLYARVDLVGTIESPLVMELELIEPELFLPMAPGSAELLAAAIAALL